MMSKKCKITSNWFPRGEPLDHRLFTQTPTLPIPFPDMCQTRLSIIVCNMLRSLVRITAAQLLQLLSVFVMYHSTYKCCPETLRWAFRYNYT